MADKLKVRNISPALQAFRNLILGRDHVPERATLRYAPLVSKRDQPPPNIPGGPAHKLSANAYCLRDGRREVTLPSVIADNSRIKLLSDGKASEKSVAIKSTKPKFPGKLYDWDTHPIITGSSN